MNLVSLDTNILVRLVINDVPEHAAAASELLSRHQSYVSDVVVTEAVFALERIYHLDRGEITAALGHIFRSRRITYNATLIDVVFELYGQRPSLSFVDCYAALEAKMRRHRLATFDKNLAKGHTHILGLP